MGDRDSGAGAGRARLAWAVAAAFGLLILGLGGDDFAHTETSRFIRPFLLWLLPDAGPATLTGLHDAIRKAAHAVEYGVFAALALRALALSGLAPRGRGAFAALSLVAALAALDEGRQATSPERTGSARDVALDLAGGAGTALALIALPERWRRRWLPGGPPA